MGHVKVIKSGKYLETFEYEKNLPDRPRKRRAKDTFSKKRSWITTRSLASVRRANGGFKRLVRANLVGAENPALFTFTLHEKLSYGASCKLFSEFASRLSRGRGKAFKYVAVPEFQKRGALHWHALIWGLPEFYACKGEWKKRGNRTFFDHKCEAGRQCERRTRSIARLWLRGFVDGVVTDGHAKLASYLTKYLQKSLHDKRTFGKKAYHASRNILRPVHLSFATTADSPVLHDPSRDLLTKSEYTSQWLGKVVYKQYEKSYDSKRPKGHLPESTAQVGDECEEW